MPSSGYAAIVFVANEQPTTAKWNLIGSNDSSFNLGTGLEDGVIVARHFAAGAVANAAVAAGAVVQVVNVETGTLATGTTTIPIDNTIPQNTEGDQYMSLAITPKATTNTLIITATAYIASSAQINRIMALFQDNTANSLASGVSRDLANNAGQIVLTHKMTTGTISTTTFKIRIGGDSANTLTFNGVSGTAYMGGTFASNITITEIKV